MVPSTFKIQGNERPLSKAVAERRATSSFDGSGMSGDALSAIVRAGMEAPSGFNLQPWGFIVDRSGEQKRSLREAAMGQMKVEEAGAVIVCWGDPSDLRRRRRHFSCPPFFRRFGTETTQQTRKPFGLKSGAKSMKFLCNFRYSRRRAVSAIRCTQRRSWRFLHSAVLVAGGAILSRRRFLIIWTPMISPTLGNKRYRRQATPMADGKTTTALFRETPRKIMRAAFAALTVRNRAVTCSRRMFMVTEERRMFVSTRPGHTALTFTPRS